MHILGIVAEFNPLHTGHAYLIQNLRRETAADYCVAVMSGDYVQRGEPALFSKYLRTKAALLSGVDLVIELPLSVSTGSAEYFAEGAVALLDRLGCVTHLGFGSESGDICAFEAAGNMLAELLAEEPEAYRTLLQQFLKAGMSFPKARYEALAAYFGNLPIIAGNTPIGGSLLSKEDISAALSLLNAPNNILGAEYVKALHKLHSPMIPVTLKRVGAGYYENVNIAQDIPAESDFDTDPRLSDFSASKTNYASASGLRKAFTDPTANIENILQEFVPAPCRFLYAEALQNRQYVTFDDFFLPLYHALQYADTESLTAFQDVTPEFAERLLRLFRESSSVTQLIALLKTKNLTSARINRSLLHILLHLTKDAAAAEKEHGYALYARILGFREEAKPLLSLIKENSAVPLVSKLADAGKILSPLALAGLEQTNKASELYRAVMPGSAPGSENSRNIVIV